MASIVRAWVGELGNRHQVALITALRGCDYVERNNSARPVVKYLRHVILDVGDDTPLAVANNFLLESLTWDQVLVYLNDFDRYPVHFTHHLLDACKVTAYKHPQADIRQMFMSVYLALTAHLHLAPETEDAMDARLNDQRLMNDRLSAAALVKH